ncbi:MAG: hypothetical protein FWB98_03500 [Defluviitaleaceae bacterium]|nr:hypothetical protein [Defluviitaleaceae bacterium]
MQRRNSHEFDFVYMDKEGDFKPLHIKLTVAENKMHLNIQSPEEIDDVAVEQIVRDIQATRLKTMRINLSEECVVTLEVEGQEGRLVTIGKGA